MATFTKTAQNVATFTKTAISAVTGYLLTPDSNYILVGSASDQFLVFSDVTTWTKTTKN